MGDILNSEYSRTAIALMEYRQAALFFDYVIPLNVSYEGIIHKMQGNELTELKDAVPLDGFIDLIPAHLNANENFRNDLAETNLAVHDMTKEIITGIVKKNNAQDANSTDLIRKATKKIYDLIVDYGLETAHIEASLASIFGKKSNNDDIVLSVASLNLIDTKKTTWEHIHEFRKSKEAVSKLRRFRSFAFDTYKDKSKAYMEDDILTKLEDYNDTVKKFGFETRKGYIESVVNGKTMAGFLSGSIFAALGESTMAIIASLAGVAIDIGSLIIKFNERKIAFGELAKTNPVSYIEYANKELTKDK